jgi:hypothetical protein
MTQTMTQTMNTSVDFESQEFAPTSVSVQPYAQIINPKITKKGMKPYGFAITKANAKLASFSPPDEWDLIEHEFASKVVEQMYITLAPRLLIIHRLPIYIFSKKESKIIGRLKDCPQFWDNRDDYKTKSYFWSIMLDKANKPCHTTPLLISAGGASGASFGLAWLQNANPQKKTLRGGFCSDMEKAYADARNQPVKIMGDLFHAHCIYQPFFEADERGTPPNTALVSVVNQYLSASIDNLIPNDSELSDFIKISKESVKDWTPRIKDLQVSTNESTISDDYGLSDDCGF